jgi:hypothetical protein
MISKTSKEFEVRLELEEAYIGWKSPGRSDSPLQMKSTFQTVLERKPGQVFILKIPNDDPNDSEHERNVSIIMQRRQGTKEFKN